MASNSAISRLAPTLLRVRSTLIACVTAGLLTHVVASPVLAADDDLRDPVTWGLVETGVRLEQSRQWREAIDHYSDALRTRPDSRHLEYGLRRSKIHFEIDRRYTDDSFTRELSELTPEDSLRLYDDILSRIRGYFVEPLSQTSIAAHGTESLWLALANKKFLDENLFGADPAAIRVLRERLHKEYWNKDLGPGTGYAGARELVIEVARMARREVSLDPQAVVMEYIFGACNCLDDYSTVLTPNKLDDLFSGIDGEFVGIGIVMEAKAGRGMQLINVLPDSPAVEAGLRRGEFIVSIDSEDVTGLSTDEAAKLLTGVAGTTVQLEVEDKLARRRVTTCSRRQVEVKSVPIAEIVDADQGIGYVRMTGFQKSTPREMDAALARLQAQGMRKLIWDVRGNPGGLLPAAIEILDRFIDSGTLVSTRGRAGDQNFSYSATRPATFRGELVLLIDGSSASASEIVAGAIRDHRRGRIVGRRTFGKWSVQSIYPTAHGAGLKLTTAKFYSPDGHNYGRKTSYDLTNGGLSPDVVVAADEENPIVPGYERIEPDDRDVLRALDLLRGEGVASR